MLQIIPVLDLKGGQIVRAAGGQRGSYRPIVTPLSASADPVDVARGLRGVHPFNTFYVADLDAIESHKPDTTSLENIWTDQAAEIWLDAGFHDEQAVLAALQKPGCHVVIGSESQIDTALLKRFRDDPRIILSLDFFAEGYCGPKQLLVEPDLWPERIIVMTLAKVGSVAGPDLDELRRIKNIAVGHGHRVFAAGGVRDENDLKMLMDIGVAGALVASGLHDGSLTPEIISRYSSQGN